MRDTAHLNRQRHTICASTHSYSPLASDALPPLGVLPKAAPKSRAPGVGAFCQLSNERRQDEKARKGTKAIMDEADRAELSECELE